MQVLTREAGAALAIKAASHDAIDIQVLQKTWTAFDRVAHLRPIRSEEEYDRTVVLMNSLLDAVGDKEKHPLSGLLDLVSELVEGYDNNHFASNLRKSP